jgi:hypothetical protein
MKYKLINSVSKIETICDKITIDGFDYYVSDEAIMQGDKWFDGTQIRSDYCFHTIDGFDRKVISTNNPNIDIPKVVDEVAKLAGDHCKYWEFERLLGRGDCGLAHDSFIYGYNKSQETHPFSEEDVVEFNEWSKQLLFSENSDWLIEKSTKELLQLWKEQKLKIVYYVD